MAAQSDPSIPLRQNVEIAIRQYLQDMGQSQPDGLYQTLLAEVEPPLIEEVLRYTQGNQSRTAKILGITRNTLRSKLNRYDIEVVSPKFSGKFSGKLNGNLNVGLGKKPSGKRV